MPSLRPARAPAVCAVALRTRLKPLSLALHLALAVAGGAGTFTAAHAQQATYDIGAGPLADVLNRFAQQSGVALAVDADKIQGLRSNGLHGSYGVEQGFGLLLRGSGYSAGRTAAGYVLVPAARANADVGAGAEAAGVLPTVTVTSTADRETPTTPAGSFVARRTLSASKVDTPLLEVPQAISVITREQMEAQNVQSVTQALRYTSGVVAEQRGVNTDALEYIYARGFRIDQYWNGLRLPNVFFNITSFDPYMFERVELIHGPASVLYGQTAPGGLLSLVSKRPTETPLHEIELQTGSFNRKQAAIDLSGPVDAEGKLLYRLTADASASDARIDYAHQSRVMIAPALTWKPNADTSLTVLANYLRDPNAGVFNYVPAEGTLLPGKFKLSPSFFAGDPNANRWAKEESSIGYELRHRLSDNWSVEQNLRYLRNTVSIQQLDTSYGLSPDGTAIQRESYTHDASFGSFTVDTRLQGQVDSGAWRHKLTFGLDYQRTDNRHLFVGQGDALGGDLNIAHPVYGIAIPQPDFVYGSSSQDVSRQGGLYAQDQIHFGKFVFLASGRQDWTDAKVTALKTGDVTLRNQQKFTWRTGVTYLTDSGFAPYASYATSFQPVVGLNSDGSVQKPTEGKQYEVGLKYQPKAINAFVTLSAFDLRQTNVVVASSQRVVSQTGEVRSRGLELEGHADLGKGLQLIASYTYNDLENSRTTDPQLLGKVPVGLPRSQASLWASYDLRTGAFNGLKLGMGVRRVGPSWGDNANTLQVPGFTLVDLSIGYDLGRANPAWRGWSTAITASNVGNKNYISTCVNAAACVYGAGRVVLANVKYNW